MFSILFKKLLKNRIFLFDEELYVYDSGSKTFITSNLTLEKIPKLSICFVGKKYIEEQALSLPVRSKRELDKVIRLKFGSKTPIYQATKSENGFKVQTWQVLVDNIKSIILVPEPYAQGFLLKEDEVCLLHNGTKSYFAVNHNGLILSSLRTNIFNSHDIFAQSLGLSIYSVKEDDCKESLAQIVAVGTFLKINLVRFLNRKNNLFAQEFSISDLLPAISIASFYFLSTSAFILYQNSTLNRELESNKQKIDSLLDIRETQTANNAKLFDYQQVLLGHQPTAHVWLMVYRLYQLDKVEFSALRFDNGEFTLIGEANKAIDVLSFVVNQPGVTNAHFMNAVRRSGDKEAFSIVFQLSNEVEQ
ncbi:hypothetical protein [Pseudoalteromonas xiamenensis]